MPPFRCDLLLFAPLAFCGKTVKAREKRGADASHGKEKKVANGGGDLVSARESEKRGFEKALDQNDDNDAEKHLAHLRKKRGFRFVLPKAGVEIVHKDKAEHGARDLIGV